MKLLKSSSFSTMYKALLNTLDNDPDFVGNCRLGEYKEILGVHLELTNPNLSLCRGLNLQYANDFYNWIMSGKDDLTEMIQKYPHVGKFEQDGQLAFSTYYGPRIIAQLDHAKAAVKTSARRAVIHILEPRDRKVLALSKSTMEYPCVKDIQLFIRNDRLLMYVSMRSNNAEKVLPYDLYNFTRLQLQLAMELGVEVGSYFHSSASMHKFIK